MSRLSHAGVGPASDKAGGAQSHPARLLVDHAGTIAAAGVCGMLAAALVAFSMPSQYRAQALVQMEAADAGQGAGPAPFEPDMLRSRTVVGPVVERLRLDIVALPQRAPLLGGLAARLAEPGHRFGPWPESLGYAWGGERIAVDSLAVPERLLNVPMLLEVLAAGEYRVSADGHELLNGQVGKPAAGNGVEMLVGAIDAAPGTRFTLVRQDLQGVVDRIARELQVEASAGAARTVRIAWESADRRNAEALVNGVANSYILGQATLRRDDVASTLAFLSRELPLAKAELDRAEEALTDYRSRSGTLQPTAEAQSFLNGSMDYQRQIAALRLQRTQLLQRFTTDSNEVRTVDSQIQQLAQERRDMDARLKNVSLSEREAVGLTRDVKVAEETYMQLRNKVQQLSLRESDSTSAMRLVDSAVASMTPVGVGPWPLTAGGGLLGLGLGMIGVSARRRWKPAVADAGEVEDEFGVPILGEVVFSREQVELERQVEAKASLAGVAVLGGPDAHALARLGDAVALARTRDGVGEDEPLAGLEEDGSMSLAGDEPWRLGLHDRFLLARCAPHSLAVEGLRNVRAALHFAVRGAPDKVVAVTSPASGAGKTFAAVNLAVLFAEAGQRVLLIDADLRRGKVARWFDQPAETGLAEVLAGHTPFMHAVRPTAVGNLSLLTAGAIPLNPSELLMLPLLGDCLRAASACFDLVLVDTPPVMAVADATLVANLAGSTLLVVRADVTPPEQVQETLKRLARADARLGGGILNGVTPRRSNRTDFDAMNPYLSLPLPPAAQQRLTQTRAIERKP
ncbi:polysaccharide biosynthesis tyrosine autokinase [Cupriavidus malaysiensis]|uniref:Tyrosine protein kinase n=1 Tax=Cupriavidus malaysiensis TaxID=367825 RepID=A0ABM6F9L5_9BURK|nr:polysaccharide biosynthesis tyrosine autokinase [Cupriavidus malaysiensis]AOZ08304.1 tyrosine protein kinase [Cupriavidus malaysiensis]